MHLPPVARCRNCGQAANPFDRFCAACGASVVPSATEIIPPEGGPRADRILEALRAATLGEYDVAGELGRGGMAIVYLAHDIQLNRKVAIKALLPELLYTEGMDLRFKQEARVAAKLDHPNILVIYGVRESKDLLYIITKLVDGRPLSAVLRSSDLLPISVAQYVIHRVADALSYAHGEGVVHRDVKPANVMVDRRGSLVVMDFGIAKAVDQANLTRTGLVIGTPAYMSPEQCLAQRVTAAADQYSLGIVAYELLTGRTPFRGSALEMQWAHTREAPEPIRALRPDCPPELEALVSRMLAKKPDDRWPSLQHVVDATALAQGSESAARQHLAALVTSEPGAPLRALPATPISPILSVPPSLDVAPAGVAAPTPVVSVPEPPSREAAQVHDPKASRPKAWRVASTAVAVAAIGTVMVFLRHPWSDTAGKAQSVPPVSPQVSAPNERTGTSPVPRAGALPGVSGDTSAVTTPATGTSPSAPPRTAAASSPTPAKTLGIVALGVSPARALPELVPGDSARIVAYALDTDSQNVPPARIAWRSSADRVATVSPTGWVKAIAPGQAEILVSADTMRRSVSVRVVPPRVARGVVADSGSQAKGGQTRQPETPAPDKSAPAPRVADAPPPARSPSVGGRDSAESAPAPAFTQAVADTLVSEFAAIINARAFDRLTGPSGNRAQSANAQMQRDFLTFLREAQPLASVQRVHVGTAAASGVELTSAIHFTWRNRNGVPFDRIARFSGLAVYTNGGWTLRDVRLLARFW